ncbi:MAG: hypothetical protein M1543_03755 [Firmicutes bacterium]|nr:hypothetical protein [Bacillota bacterium]
MTTSTNYYDMELILMIRSIKHTQRKITKTFTLNDPQPVKSPFFLIFPVRGKLEIKNLKENTFVRKYITIYDFMELRNHLYE